MSAAKQLPAEPVTEEPNCDGQHPHHVLSRPIPEEPTLQALAELYKMFGDVTRVKIMCALYESELCVCELSAALGMGQSAVSHQLRLLRGARLVKVRREGKSSFYSLDDDHVMELVHMGLDHILEQKR